MAIQVNKRKGENTNSLIYRFSRRVRKSGIMAELKSRQFKTRPENKQKRKKQALYRKKREDEMKWARKMGEL